MKVYRFGNEANPTLMLLPGTCCHYKKNFGHVIPLLEKDFYVLAVSYDGFDETEDTIFPDMLKETEKIEEYINKNFDGKIDLAYGCSLGGSFVSLLVQRKNVHIDKAILGSSDMDQSGKLSARIKCGLFIPMIYKMIHTGELPGFMRKKYEKKKSEYMDFMLSMFGIGTKDMSFVKKESVYNQFYSDLVTSVADGIEADNTKIYVFYAKQMGEKYLKRYYKHFKSPIIIEHDLQHEELLAMYKEKWVEEIKKIM